MRYEICCGFVAYHMVDGEPHYLVIQSVNGRYSFPKGHMEPGETELQTALREVLEETNITVEPLPGFRHQLEYPLPGFRDAVKRVVYFVGACANTEVIPQVTEVSDAAILSYEKAMDLLAFDNLRTLLREADGFIRAHTQAQR